LIAVATSLAGITLQSIVRFINIPICHVKITITITTTIIIIIIIIIITTTTTTTATKHHALTLDI
jgi:hypothetical protein